MANSLDTWPAGATAQMIVTYTQANAAGGAVVCEISPGTGQEFIVLSVIAQNSGTNGIVMFKESATAGTQLDKAHSVASGAGTIAILGVGTVSNTFTSNNISGLGYPYMVSGSQAFRIAQTGAGAQNDTFLVIVNVRVKLGAMPTVIHTNSTNPANVSVTAGAESFTVI